MSALDWFLKIKGSKQGDIKGESQDDAHKEQIELLSAHHQIKVPRDMATGQATGRRQHGEFVITKHIDKATPPLLSALVHNEMLTEMTIECLRADGGKKVKYFVIVLKNAYLADYQLETPPAGADLPKERWAFRYASIEWTYTAQSRKDGTGGGTLQAADDLTRVQ